MNKYKVGHIFGHWKLLSDVIEFRHVRYANGKQERVKYAHVLCTLCGTEHVVSLSRLKTGRSTMCSKCRTRHAQYGHMTKRLGRVQDTLDKLILRRHKSIMSRCLNPADPGYDGYGARGIRVSEEFRSARNFVEYMRSLPNCPKSGVASDLQIDRIDNSRGYERGNLRWATPRENVMNRRTSKWVDYRGHHLPLKDFCTMFCAICYQQVRKLYNSGVPLDDIVTRKAYPRKARQEVM